MLFDSSLNLCVYNSATLGCNIGEHGVRGDAGKQLASGHLRQRFPLLLPALRGLTHFAHRLSLEYFGDLIAALLQLVKAPNLPTLERLHCLLAVSDILRSVPSF